jgi:hypothetical protein
MESGPGGQLLLNLSPEPSPLIAPIEPSLERLVVHAITAAPARPAAIPYCSLSIPRGLSCVLGSS